MDDLSTMQNTMPLYSDYLSLVGFFLTIVGFGITTYAAVRARKAADAARDASLAATIGLRRADFVSEASTIIHLIEEIKRLHRSSAFELLPERYAAVRSRVISIRESGLVVGEEEPSLLQDVVARVASLERLYDADNAFLSDAKKLVKSNESLSLCTDSLHALIEKVKIRMVVIK